MPSFQKHEPLFVFARITTPTNWWPRLSHVCCTLPRFRLINRFITIYVFLLISQQYPTHILEPPWNLCLCIILCEPFSAAEACTARHLEIFQGPRNCQEETCTVMCLVWEMDDQTNHVHLTASDAAALSHLMSWMHALHEPFISSFV